MLPARRASRIRRAHHRSRSPGLSYELGLCSAGPCVDLDAELWRGESADDKDGHTGPVSAQPPRQNLAPAHGVDVTDEVERHLDEVAGIHLRGSQVALQVVPRDLELIDGVTWDGSVKTRTDLTGEDEQALSATQLDLMDIGG